MYLRLVLWPLVLQSILQSMMQHLHGKIMMSCAKNSNAVCFRQDERLLQTIFSRIDDSIDYFAVLISNTIALSLSAKFFRIVSMWE